MSEVMNPHDQPAPSPDHQSQEAAPAAEPVPSRPSRKAAWIGMGAVLGALVLLMLIPEQRPVDPNAPPPAADGGEHEDGDGVLIGKNAALHFTLKDMHGGDVVLSSYKGKVIILNFWATWCGPCKAEIPGFVRLQEKYRDKGLVIVGYSVDDTAEKAKAYAAQYKMNYPILLGEGREELQDAYGPIWGIPASFIISKDGKVCRKHMGIAPEAVFEKEVVALLN
jgi:thiol-disulfide isomerase/thioredoxin